MIQDLLPLAGPYFLPWLESESEVAQSCPTPSDPMDCSLPGSEEPLSPWNFLGKSTAMGCHFLPQRIFPTQRLSPGLPHCRQRLYHLSHQGNKECLILISPGCSLKGLLLKLKLQYFGHMM